MAARWAGFQTIGFSEIDEYCCKILKRHWPEVPNYGDIRNVPTFRCELITGGPPCQPFSIAGRKGGEADNRNLWPAMLGVIGCCRPAWVVVENVVGAADMVLSKWQDDLAKLGYQSKGFDIPSCAVGLPSVERHIWLVAANSSVGLEGSPKEILSGESKQGALQRQWRPHDTAIEAGSNGRDLPDARLLRSRKGIPHFVDRIRGIGNAVPPQIAYQILKAIVKTMNQPKP